MNKLERILAYLAVSLVSSFIFAVTWVILMTLTLPETDMAHGQAPFQDPLVFPIMSMFAGVSALLAWPFYTIFGWRHSPVRFGITAAAAALAFIVIATPFDAGIGWLGSYLVLLVALIVCKFKMKENGQPRAQGDGGSACGSNHRRHDFSAWEGDGQTSFPGRDSTLVANMENSTRSGLRDG